MYVKLGSLTSRGARSGSDSRQSILLRKKKDAAGIVIVCSAGYPLLLHQSGQHFLLSIIVLTGLINGEVYY